MASKASLIQEVAGLVAMMQAATATLDQEAAAYLGLNLTDLHCLDVIAREGPMTPGALAEAVGRTPAAITVVIDRLEDAGYAERTRDTVDRRRILVRPTEQAMQQVSRLWGPIEEEGVDLLGGFTMAQLEAFAAFLRAGTELQRRHAVRLRRLAEGGKPDAAS